MRVIWDWGSKWDDGAMLMLPSRSKRWSMLITVGLVLAPAGPWSEAGCLQPLHLLSFSHLVKASHLQGFPLFLRALHDILWSSELMRAVHQVAKVNEWGVLEGVWVPVPIWDSEANRTLENERARKGEEVGNRDRACGDESLFVCGDLDKQSCQCAVITNMSPSLDHTPTWRHLSHHGMTPFKAY